MKGVLSVYLGEDGKKQWEVWCRARGLKAAAAVKDAIFQQLNAGESPSRTVEPRSFTQADHPDRAQKKAIEVRLTPSELDALNQSAELQGCSRQRWLVNLIRGALTHQPQMGMREIEALGDSNYQLLAIGRNLNQIAKRLNEGHRDELTVGYIDRLESSLHAHTDQVARVMRASIDRWGLQ